MIKAKIKISGQQPDLEKILKNFPGVKYSIATIVPFNSVILSVECVPSVQILNEIVRRLGGKRGRKTVTELERFENAEH